MAGWTSIKKERGEVYKMNKEITLNNTVDAFMEEIYRSKSGEVVVGAWGRDVGTMELRLKLSVVYPNGDISPIRNYPKHKLINYKVLNDLTDLDAITPQMVPEIYNAVVNKSKKMPVQEDGSGKCSIKQAYKALCDYVRKYEEPGRVFIQKNYGNILASYLPSVLDKLQLGFGRLELQRNFKAWGLLRTSENAGHVYAYAIKTGSFNNWFFSFKLLEESEVTA